LSPLPCWASLPAERYRQRIEALVGEAAVVRRRSGSRVLGVKAILAQDPQARSFSECRASISRRGLRHSRPRLG